MTGKKWNIADQETSEKYFLVTSDRRQCAYFQMDEKLSVFTFYVIFIR